MQANRSLERWLGRGVGAMCLALAAAACSAADGRDGEGPEAIGAVDEALVSCPGSPGACAEHPYPFELQPVTAGLAPVALATTKEVFPVGHGWESPPPNGLQPSTCEKGDRVCELEGLLGGLGCNAGGSADKHFRTYARMTTGAYCSNFFLWARCPAASTKRLRELSSTAQFGGDTCPGVFLRIDFYFADPAKTGADPIIYCPTPAAQAGKCNGWGTRTTPDPTWRAVVDWDPLCPGACFGSLIPRANPADRMQPPATVYDPPPG